MLGTKSAVATIAVKDLKIAKKFYEEAVGLTPAPASEMGTVAYQTGSTRLFVYESQYAGTNRATAVTWIVGNELESIVKALASKGVVFEHYQFPHTVRTGDIHVSGNMRLAWFKDPDGNIHGLANG